MTIKNISCELLKHDSILIFCHSRPDGDTLGCALALRQAFIKTGKIVDIICDSVIPDKYSFLPDYNCVYDLSKINKKYSAHVAVDCSVEGMIGNNLNLFKKNNNTFNIDHHCSNSHYAKYNLVDERASCCEIIYHLIQCLGIDIDERIANFLMVGICTDTGNFAHSNVTPETLIVAAELLKKGADLHNINLRMFNSQKYSRAKLYTKVMSGLRLYLDDKLAIISIFKKDIDEFDATSSMTEGFIDFPLSIEGVEVAVSILENGNNNFKISYRSKGRVDVNEIASVFGGGGHILASGSVISGFYEDVKDKIIRTVSLYM